MIHDQMHQELKDKNIFEQARRYAYQYIDGIHDMDVFPSEDSVALLSHFDEDLPSHTSSGEEVLDLLNKYGSLNTTAQNGPRYFGYVNGGAIPAAVAVKWLADVWDQNGGLYNASPINAKLEAVCESWLKELFHLPDTTVAGFVSGTSTANLCCLIAARYAILKKMGWDINEKGLNGAPQIRIIAHQQVHASIKQTLALIGFGRANVEWYDSDDQGRAVVDDLPDLDDSCILLLQAGNANTGAFDDFKSLCPIARAAGAWIHIDGAFGLWAGATRRLQHLTQGMELADSWAVDGHKTLNTPYDCGIALCKDPDAMITALLATGEYLIYSDKRDPLMYTQEMSKRARALELWATMKYLGRQGIEELVDGLHERSLQLATGLSDLGLTVINEVVFNQVLIHAESDNKTEQLLQRLQSSGKLWLGGSSWLGKKTIRNSICSWATTQEDIDMVIDVYRNIISDL